MCLSTVYTVDNGEENMVCEYVSNIDVGDNKITLTDVIGKEVTVNGTVLSVDLINNKILIKSA